MAKDDIFKISFLILNSLYGHMKEGTKVVLTDISPAQLGINDSYWLDIVSELMRKGYIRGPLIRETKNGRIVSRLEDMQITFEGVEYLQENGQMKKVYEALKELRDWVPIF